MIIMIGCPYTYTIQSLDHCIGVLSVLIETSPASIVYYLISYFNLTKLPSPSMTILLHNTRAHILVQISLPK